MGTMTNSIFSGNAAKTGTEFTREGLAYCEDDNTYRTYTFQTKAWACPVVLKTQLTCPSVDLFTELFGDA